MVKNAQKWLDEDGSFNAGVELLRELGGDVRAWLPYGRMAFLPVGVKERLREEVRSTIERQETSDKKPATRNQRQETSTEPPEVLRLRELGKRLLKRQAHAHSSLKLAPDDATRYEIARELMEQIVPEVDAVYNALRAYERDGVLPPDNEQEIVQDTVQQMLKIQSLKPRISRLRKWTESGKKDGQKLTNKEIADYRQELLEKEVELEEIKEKLGLDE